MTHKDLINKFKSIITLWSPIMAKAGTQSVLQIKGWWKKGPNGIRVRLNDGSEIVFTYISDSEWKVETLSMWEQSKNSI